MESSKAIATARKLLTKNGVANSGLDATILMAHALLVSKEQVIFNPQRQLNKSEQEIFFNLINRRANREPVSHLIGKREFFGEDFIVSKDVLDPRPDSEILIEAVITSFETARKHDDLKILELGVGSGCLIITLLKIFKNANATAVDISSDAIKIAQENAKKHQVFNRLSIIESDLFNALDQQEKFDLIISNPPYIPSSEIANLELEVQKYEPITALDGGEDGLDFYRRIAAEAKNFLTKSGKIFVEIGYQQSDDVTKIFHENNFLLTNSIRDLSGITRVLQFNSNVCR